VILICFVRLSFNSDSNLKCLLACVRHSSKKSFFITLVTVVQYCTLLDAIKAFDRVNYCKLFNLLIDCQLPPVILRFLLQMYTGFKACIFWIGLYSNTFAVNNGVKQGVILSAVLFCIYFDVLINR